MTTRYTDFMDRTTGPDPRIPHPDQLAAYDRLSELSAHVLLNQRGMTPAELNAYLDDLVQQAVDQLGGDERLTVWFLLGLLGVLQS